MRQLPFRQHLILQITAFFLTYDSVKADNWTVISKIQADYLEKYKSYVDVTVMHFNVPPDVPFVSFKFEADEIDLSIFGCSARDVELYLKSGSPPVINPDSSKVPDKFLKDGRPSMYKLNFKSDGKPSYVNISSPITGNYYAAVYHPYTDPKSEAIKQDGLSQMCNTNVEVTLYAIVTETPRLILADDTIDVSIIDSETIVYKFYVPSFIDRLRLFIKEATWNGSDGIRFAIHPNNVTLIVLNDTSAYEGTVWVNEDTWYFITISLIKHDLPHRSLSSSGKLRFSFHYLRNELYRNLSSKYYKNAAMKSYKRANALYDRPYKEYELIRLGSTDSFVYTYETRTLDKRTIASSSLNVTSTDLTVLKFRLNDFVDVGGTLHFVLSHKPTEHDIDKRHVIVACIHNERMTVPKWPNRCATDTGDRFESQVVLNATTRNASVLIPYPEAGVWYATVQLYCDECVACNCTDECAGALDKCKDACDVECDLCMRNCSSGGSSRGCETVCDDECNRCDDRCEMETARGEKSCETCDCYDDCKRSVCNSSLIYAIGSYPCVVGGCGKHGKCVFSLADGFAYSACLCTDSYKGWDCTDDTDARSFAAILIELLLLVLSNLGFLAVTVIAYRRDYKVESIVYFATFFFSTFYHACDAGENTIGFCLVRLSVLQFCDFYCGLLSIWVTLVAMAQLNDRLIATWALHVVGCVLLAFGTAYNKTSLWVFILPAVVGLIVIAVGWYGRYRKTGHVFDSRRYLRLKLPIGGAVVAVALIVYGLLQTQSNYKYLHSSWHVMMALGVAILLPTVDDYLPSTLTR